jgi:hypothetical protein
LTEQLLWGNAMSQAAKSNLLAIAGAIVGGLIGYFIFIWLASQGFYGLIIPGGLIGIAAGFAKSKSLAIAIVCGIAALFLGLFCEWKFAPFNADDSLGYLLSHFYELKPVTLLMIAAGAAIGFWAPFRHRLDGPTTSP